MLRARGAAGTLLRLARCSNGAERIGGAPLARAAFSRDFFNHPRTANKIWSNISRNIWRKNKVKRTDEMSGGCSAAAETRKNSGKADAVRFPDLDVESPDGGSLRLPLVAPSPEGDDHEAGGTVAPVASLVCLSFDASSQKMAESWSLRFLDAFGAAKNIHVYEVSLKDSRPLSSSSDRGGSLNVMRKSNNPQRHVVYAFGDHSHFLEELQIRNHLTGYIYLVDRLGRIRWHDSTQEEFSSLTTCTSTLLDGK